MPASDFVSAVQNGASLPAEHFLERAWIEWLPTAARRADSAEAEAARVLSRMLVAQHRDFLLRDVLATLRNRGAGSAATLLATAIRANMTGDRASGVANARRAAE